MYSDWVERNPRQSDKQAVNVEFVLKMLDKIMDMIHPIGSYYIQFAKTDGAFGTDETPQLLFGGVWQQLWSNEGVYFQTEDNSSTMARTNGLQEDAIRNIEGTIVGSLNSDIQPFRGATNPFYLEKQSGYNRSVDWEYSHQGGYGSIKMNLSRSVPVDTRNHPRNRLIRVWKRTA
jgi:uncharacterized protein YdeI (BOF family)